MIQIKIKQGLRLLTEITKLDFGHILELVIALNLDYAMAVKQILSNSKHKHR